MSLLRHITSGLRSLFRREQVDRELDEELGAYLEMQAADKMNEGMSRNDAVRSVHLESGSVELAKEIVRSGSWESLFGTQEQLVDATIVPDRMLAELSGFIGLSAAILVCLGLYGLTAYQVSRRTAEIGVRMALGAQRRNVVSMLLKSSLVLVVTGAAAGIGATLLSVRLVASLLFGVQPLDAVTLLVTPLILVAIGAAATHLPAHRATKIDPMVALRYE
ncbi:MAG: hypothetical protein DMG38_09165 [Acidobacteria bacterium]|nr:MAG: hypothetical protein DMG38_09165 [Acidobacteriota bacterium]